MTFKSKNKVRNSFNNKKNIDLIHFDILKEFENEKKNITIYKSELINLNKKITKIKKEIFKDSNPMNTLDLQLKLCNLEDTKEEIEKKINNIDTSKKEKQYLIDTSKLLTQYYKVKENETTETKINIKKTKELNSKNNLLSWFKDNKKYNSKNQEILKLKEKTKEEKKNEKIDKLNKMSKKELYENYMNIINDDENTNIIENTSYNICEHCNKELLMYNNEGLLICNNCGLQEKILLDFDKPSYKNPPKEITSFCYKRINHLNEFLAQFQAKESTIIPDNLYNEILIEIKKQRIKNMANITPEKMRLILRKIKRNDYYEHIPYIINQLNGLPPPVISSEIEEIIRNMFKEIQIPFEELKPKINPKRKNFLSYNYVMYKFFELLELDEYLECFLLLKSRNKLHQQDIIWKEICRELKWQYIPSL